MKLYVGNLPWATSEDDLRAAFAPYKITGYVRIIRDQETGRSKGFGFVEVEEGEKAITEMNGSEFGGRVIKVSQAIRRNAQAPKTEA